MVRMSLCSPLLGVLSTNWLLFCFNLRQLRQIRRWIIQIKDFDKYNKTVKKNQHFNYTLDFFSTIDLNFQIVGFRLDGYSLYCAHQRYNVPVKRYKKLEEGDLSIEVDNHSRRIFTLIRNSFFSTFQCDMP